jgi:hypothetical protein
MKKVFFSVLFIICIVNISISQTTKVKPKCPPGYCIINPAYVIDVFNFHKPRTSCSSRFGLCIEGHWTYDCVPVGTPGATHCNLGNEERSRLRVENGKVYVAFIIVDDVLELYIPKSLAQTEQFKNEDLTKFYIDDNTIQVKNPDGTSAGYLKAGEYTTTMDNLVITVRIPII